MKEKAKRLFNIYSGEGYQALHFAVLGFLMSFALFLGTKLSDALFVIHLGAARLPYAYTTAAFLLMLSASYIIYAFNQYSMSTILSRFLVGSLIFYGCVIAFMSFGLIRLTPWTWFVLRVMNQVFYIVNTSCFWNFLDQYYHFQDAKRLFTIFTSSVHLGALCTGFIIESGSLEVVQIYELMVVLMAGALFMSRRITKKFEEVPDDAEVEGKQTAGIQSLLLAVSKSPFTIFLMVASLLFYLLMTTTEFNYLASFQVAFGTTGEGDEASFALTRFIGKCMIGAGLLNLLADWFGYTRLLARFRITTLILVTPVSYTITYFGWPFDTTLAFPLLAFLVVESLYPMMEDNNFNLLLNAVPLKIKSRVRVMIESF